MQKFTDNVGREWSISLNGWQLKKLKHDLGFAARDPESIFRAAEDPGLLCDVLYVLCEDQAKAAGVTDRQFGEALTGDAIDAAAEAYMLETVDFFPQRQRPALKKALAKIREIQEKETKAGMEKLESKEFETMLSDMLTAKGTAIDKMMRDVREKFLAGTIIGNSSGNAPGSPA